jgi:hypothetical protein
MGVRRKRRRRRKALLYEPSRIPVCQQTARSTVSVQHTQIIIYGFYIAVHITRRRPCAYIVEGKPIALTIAKLYDCTQRIETNRHGLLVTLFL